MRLRMLSSVLVLAIGCGGDGSAPPADTSSLPDDSPGHTIHIATGTATDAAYAFQDGDGAWQAAPAPSAGTITLSIGADRYAVARLCGGSRIPRVIYRASSETEQALPCNGPGPVPAGSIGGTITSNPDDNHQLLHGDAFAFLFDENPSFPYEVATEGTSDLVVAREPLSGDAIDVLHVERDLAVTAAVTRDLDFGSLEAPITIPQPIPNDSGSAYTAFMPSADVYQFSIDSVPPFVHTALPVATRRSTDRYDVGVIVDLSADSTIQFDKVLAVPAAVTAPTANLLAPLSVTDGAELVIGWNKLAETTAVNATVDDATGFGFTDFSAAWQATFAGDQLAFAPPDLSAVVGWPARGGLRSPATFVQITAVVEVGTFPADGYEATAYQRSFTAANVAPPSPRLRRTLEQTRLGDRRRRH